MHARRKFFEQIVTAGVLLGLKEAALLAAEDIYLGTVALRQTARRQSAGCHSATL